MRTLIVSELVTLDGVMEAPGGEPSHPHTNWVSDFFQSEHEGAYKEQELFDVESLLLGRTTYESFAGAWPTYEGRMADRMNSMPKHVVSSTLTHAEWNGTTVLQGDPMEAVAALKAGDGGPIMVNGSATLVHALLDHGLVDELRLMVFPVTIGDGLRVFSASRDRKVAWRLDETQSFPSGVRVETWRPA